MTEPETITLRRLPPEHVLRENVDLVLESRILCTVSSSAGLKIQDVPYQVSACYCRAEDYPPEYDNPAIDPGEGWRIYDQHKEGMEPRPDAQYRTHIGTWLNRPSPKDNLTHSDVYRVPVTPQPDRLTELRQQGERQAVRIEELEASEKELQEKLRILKHNHSEQGKALAEQGEYIESLQTQVRSAEEALRVEKQKHDEAVRQLEATSKPLRWERRKPTEEECSSKTFLWVNRNGYTYTAKPGEYLPGDFYVDDLICILPPIAEPERRMVTQRRWLVNGPDGWQEEWPKDGEFPCGKWLEGIETSRTREVPE